jgi:glycosyltransferase involved in cell wall biosynthesis
LVTVVIVAWDDYVPLVPEALKSVNEAATGEVPVVVVDNASEHPLPELPDVRTTRLAQRVSVGAARTVGLQQVRTPYVIALDADDLMLPGTIDFLVSRLEANSGAAACSTALLEEDTGARHRTPRRFASRLTQHSRLFALANTVWSLYPVQGCTIMRTRDALEAGGYPDADWGDDWVLGMSLAFRGSVELHERFGLLYRATPGSLWRTPKSAAELANSARLVRTRIRDDPGLPAWARALLPAIASLQLLAVYAARPVYRRLRRG